MSRAKVSLANGTVVEKPVVTCFKGGNATYLVMDNEANGQMGYPIICISRLNNTVVEKITDQNEWAGVKENLKTIIGGTALPYVAVPDLLTGQDDFFTQLTLPVASFDALKNAYAPASAEGTEQASAPAPEAAPVVTPVEAPVTASVAPTPEIPAAPSVAAPEPSTVSPAPVATTIGTVPATEPVMTAPVITPLPAAPAMPDMTVAPLPVTTPAQTPMPEPVVETPAPVTPAVELATSVNDIQAIKDSFMKSCENMFDALIKKFENK